MKIFHFFILLAFANYDLYAQVEIQKDFYDARDIFTTGQSELKYLGESLFQYRKYDVNKNVTEQGSLYITPKTISQFNYEITFNSKNEIMIDYSTAHEDFLYVIKESGIYTYQSLAKPPFDSLIFDSHTKELYQAGPNLSNIKNDHLLLLDYAFEGAPKKINNIILFSLNNKKQLKINPPNVELYGMNVLETFISKDSEYIILKTHAPTGPKLICYS